MFIVWFNLIMYHHGQVFLIDTFDTYEECYAVQLEYEAQQPEDSFACPFVKVEEA